MISSLKIFKIVFFIWKLYFIELVKDMEALVDLEEKMSFLCDYCGNELSDFVQLAYHVEKIHMTSYGSRTCHVCDKKGG